jgi:branched-chain amino acid transport system permease protein
MAIDRPCGTFDRSYAQTMAIFRTRLQWILLFLGLALLLTMPLFAGSDMIYMVNYIAITLIAVQGLNILTGYTGLLNLGQAAFMAVGAYTSAVLTAKFGVSFWVAMPCAALNAGLIGLIFGLPSLRIKGFYLGMSTLAAQFIIISAIVNLRPDLTAGWSSLVVPVPSIGDFKFNDQYRMFYIIVPMALLIIFFTKNMMRTGVGRAFIAIRDNDLAAEVMGINIFRYKLLSFFICTAFAGLAGCLWAHWMRAITPDQFGLNNSVWLMGMVIVGGMGSVSGAIFGTIFIRVLDEVAKSWVAPLVSGIFPSISSTISAALVPLFFSIVIILFVVFEPRGLAHRWQIFKTSYRLNPFSY